MATNPRRRFATLIRVRRLQEDLKAQALAAVRREIDRATWDREELESQQRRALEEAGEKAERVFTVAEVGRYYQYERHLARLVVEKDAQIVQLRRRESQTLAELGEATRRKRTVERLSERAEDSYAAWVRKQTQAISDEIATNKAAAARGLKRAT